MSDNSNPLFYVAPLSDTNFTSTIDEGTRTYNVKNYGALGNGSADDTMAIKAAISAASDGGIIHFPAGTYMTDPVYFMARQSVSGAGQYTSIIKRNPTTTSNLDSIGVINFHGSSEQKLQDFTVKNIGIDGNKSGILIDAADPMDVEALSLKYSERFVIDNIRTFNAYSDGIDLDDCVDGLVTNSYTTNNGGSGIHVSERSVGNSIIGNHTTGNGFAHSRSGIDQYSSASNSVFIGNVSSANNRGYKIEGTGAIYQNNNAEGNSNANVLTGVI